MRTNLICFRWRISYATTPASGEDSRSQAAASRIGSMSSRQMRFHPPTDAGSSQPHAFRREMPAPGPLRRHKCMHGNSTEPQLRTGVRRCVRPWIRQHVITEGAGRHTHQHQKIFKIPMIKASDDTPPIVISYSNRQGSNKIIKLS